MTNLQSLDPRINRLGVPATWEKPVGEIEQPDQLETYEVFHESKEGKPFTHVGPVHASTLEMAFLYAKEQYGRRYSCVGMWTIKTSHIMVSRMGNDNENVFDKINFENNSQAGIAEKYEIFFQRKKGTHHVHVGEVSALSYEHALEIAKNTLNDGKNITNVWVAKQSDFYKSQLEDKIIWDTVLEKKYRDAIAYKVADRIEKFKLQHQS